METKKSHKNRSYVRHSHFLTDAQISADNFTWKPVVVENISAGGMRVRSKKKLSEKGGVVWVQIRLKDNYTEFSIKCQCTIRSSDEIGGEHYFSMAYLNLHESSRIRIDESIMMQLRAYGGSAA